MVGQVLRKTWEFLSRVDIAIITILCIVINLIIGYVYLRHNTSLFSPINEIGILKWIVTYGAKYIIYSWWFFVFLFLLLILSIQTFICSSNKIIKIIHSNRKNKFILLSPHIMHYALLFILGGFLISYIFSYSYPIILIPNKNIRLSDTKISLILKNINIRYYKGKRLSYLYNRPIYCKAIIKLCYNNGNNSICKIKNISINSPIIYRTYSFHLNKFGNNYVFLICRKDPGIWVYIFGTFLFLSGLIIYGYGMIIKAI